MTHQAQKGLLPLSDFSYFAWAGLVLQATPVKAACFQYVINGHVMWMISCCLLSMYADSAVPYIFLQGLAPELEAVVGGMLLQASRGLRYRSP